MASTLKKLTRITELAGLQVIAEQIYALRNGLNSAIVPYLNNGAPLANLTAQLPWPVILIPNPPGHPTNKKAVVNPNWSRNIGDIADVERLMGWALQKRRHTISSQMTWLTAVPPPGPRPELRQGDALLARIDSLINYWPRYDMDEYEIHACWDIVLTTQAMLNAMLCANPGDGGGGDKALPPSDGG